MLPWPNILRRILSRSYSERPSPCRSQRETTNCVAASLFCFASSCSSVKIAGAGCAARWCPKCIFAVLCCSLVLLAHNAISLQLLGWGMVGAYRLPIRVRPLDEVPVFAARLLIEFPKQTLGGLSVKLGRWLGG